MKSVAGDRLKRAVSGIAAQLEPRGAAVFWSVDVCPTQRRAERTHSRRRSALLKMDRQIGKQLAFSGSHE
jgi:hypothetical protein